MAHYEVESELNTKYQETGNVNYHVIEFAEDGTKRRIKTFNSQWSITARDDAYRFAAMMQNAQSVINRYLTLVQILAMDKSDDLKLTDLRTIANSWKVNPYGTYSELLQRLAQHAIKSHNEFVK